MEEIRALPPWHLAVRCIRCGDDAVRVLAEREELDSLILDTATNLSEDGFTQLTEIDNLVYLLIEDASSLS